MVGLLWESENFSPRCRCCCLRATGVVASPYEALCFVLEKRMDDVRLEKFMYGRRLRRRSGVLLFREVRACSCGVPQVPLRWIATGRAVRKGKPLGRALLATRQQKQASLLATTGNLGLFCGKWNRGICRLEKVRKRGRKEKRG